VQQIAVRIEFTQRDGRFYARSSDVPGLHLAGPDIDALHRDIEPVLKDLLWHNSDIVVDKLAWVPSLKDLAAKLKGPQVRPVTGEQTYLITVKDAA
jgi:hypothetical protein